MSKEKRFLVYDMRAKEGENGYLPTIHDLRPESDWWCRYYQFTRYNDDTYEMQLDEMETFGSSTSHCGGGVCYDPIPKEWFELPYDEFLEKVLTLCYGVAKRFNFTVEDLKSKTGLKEFFGY